MSAIASSASSPASCPYMSLSRRKLSTSSTATAIGPGTVRDRSIRSASDSTSAPWLSDPVRASRRVASRGGEEPEGRLDRRPTVGGHAALLEVGAAEVEADEAPRRRDVRADGRVEEGGRRVRGDEQGLAARGQADDDQERAEHEHEEDGPDGSTGLRAQLIGPRVERPRQRMRGDGPTRGSQKYREPLVPGRGPRRPNLYFGR